MVPVPNIRILVLGLGASTQGNNGIGARLARSLSSAFHGVEVRPATDFAGFAEVLHDYDLVVVLNSISFCSNVGHVSRGSAYSVANRWESRPAQAEAFAQALSYARLMGHRLPRIEVINVCIGLEDWAEQELSPSVSAMYRGILGRVKALVREVIREVERAATIPTG